MTDPIEAYWPKTLEQLSDYVRELVEAEHGYETSADAMTRAALAAFNYVASELGCTGFQAGWAQLQFIKVARHMEGPFGIADGTRLLYPQYDLEGELDRWITEWKPAVAPLARKKLREAEEKGHKIHPEVEKRWIEAAKWDDGATGD